MNRLSSILIFLGILLILVSILFLAYIFLPVFMVEVKYQISPPIRGQKLEIVPANKDFGLVIPKIGANARVIANIDPHKSFEYQVALTQGVAHARGSVYPGQPGNVFIFAHSSADLLQARRFNSVFYLLDKLEIGDEIQLYYNKEYFEYQVREKKIIPATEISYLSKSGDKKTVTLMTCWPPGTTLKRMIVIGEITTN